MNRWTFVGLLWWLLPAALVLWRSAREPAWLAPLRYLLAFAVGYVLLFLLTDVAIDANLAAARASGDGEALDGDTGFGAAFLLLGWLMVLAYLVGLGLLRALWRWVAARRARTHPA